MNSDFWSLQSATTLLGFVLAVGMLLLFLTVDYKILTDKINLSSLISESDGSGKTSISRFQVLVFTLAIAGLYIILSIEAGTLIDVPNGALLLLGISHGSFAVSKGISHKGRKDAPAI